MKFLRLAVLAAFFAMTAACREITGLGAALPVSGEYMRWWGEIETCSGLHRPIESVRFYESDRLPIGTIGFTRDIEAPITTVEIAPAWTHVEWLVKHEMMHAHGIVAHDPHYFAGVCGNLMP